MLVFTALKNIILILLLLIVVFGVSFFAEPVKNMALGMLEMEDDSVLGASSSRAQEITGKVGSDIVSQLDGVKEQILSISVGDAVIVIMRAQKIPQDVNAAFEFGKEQIEKIAQ